MITTLTKIRKSVRIIGTIATKDIFDALKNKSYLVNFVMVFFLIALYKWMPTLYNPSHTDIVIYDASNSSLSSAFEESPSYRMRAAGSPQELNDFMSEGDEGSLGFAIPVGYDDIVEIGGHPELAGYVMWEHRFRAAELATEFEQHILELTNQTVSIKAENIVHHNPNSMGAIRMVSITPVIIIFFTALLLVPNLLFEEKQSKTLDALLVSPASVGQVVIAKAIVGLFYSLLIVAFAMLINWKFVTQWGLIIFVGIIGSLFAVGLGLMMGILVDDRKKFGSWIMILSQPFLIPVFLSALDPILPAAMRKVLYWVPTGAQALLFRFGLSAGATLPQILTSTSILLGSTVVMFSLVIWRVRRLDR
ncbi:MAG: ABC transporter permease [Chloroflexi bacterium]|nr:ABC transporter permease [Chloroflexota bacterium]